MLKQPWFAGLKLPWLASTDARQFGRTLVLFGVMGVLAGLAAVVFVGLTEIFMIVQTHLTGGFHNRGLEPGQAGFVFGLPQGREWLVLVVPGAGALISGVIGARFAVESMRGGSSRVIEAYHERGGRIRKRVAPIKAFTSAVTISSGGSAGFEGPIALICGALGSLVSEALKLGTTERRVLLAAGAAAGVGAVFHTPLGAALIIAEFMYVEADLEHEVLVPSIIAATVAYAVFGAIHGWESLFSLPHLVFDDGRQLVAYTLLAGVLAVGVYIVVGTSNLVDRFIGSNARIPLWLRPAVGGLLVGVIGVFLPQALGAGYHVIQVVVNGGTPVWLLLALAVAKAITNALTANSGGSGGRVAPVLVGGALMGGAVGEVGAQLFPELHIAPAAFAVVGMAGLLAGSLKVPLGAVILAAEVVGDYGLLVPTLWVCILTTLLTRRRNLLDTQVRTRFDAPNQLSDMMGAVLEHIRVSEALDPARPRPVAVPPGMSMRELLHRFAAAPQAVFPIVEPDTGRLRGVVDGHQLRRHLAEEGLSGILIVSDFLSPALSVSTEQTLFDAIKLMSSSGYEDLLVVDANDPSRLVAVLSRREIISTYHRRMLAPGEVEAARPAAVDERRPLTSLVAALRRGGIFSRVIATERSAVLAEMVWRANLPVSFDRLGLIAQLEAREVLGTTGIGDGVALPHPQLEDTELDEPLLLLGRLVKPVDWEALDDRPVDTVCLLMSPNSTDHLALLAGLARAIGDPELRRLLSEHAEPHAILARFERLEADLAKGP